MTEIDRMDPQAKAEWIAALRSGDYAQGEGSLRYGGDYCCLGVLCDLKKSDTSYWQNARFVHNGSVGAGVLPFGLAMELNTRGNTDLYGQLENTLSINPVFYVGKDKCGEDVTYSLAELNDEGFTFDQIADIIDYFL